MSEARRPVLLFRNGLGDHLTSLPAVRALAKTFAGRLTLICRHGSHRTFFSRLPFRDVHELAIDRGQFDAARVPAATGCDLFLSLNPWHSESVDDLLARLRPRRSIGFYPAFSIELRRDYGKHAAQLAFDVARTVRPDVKLEDFTAPPPLPAAARAFARRVWTMFPRGSRVVAVHAESTDRAKMWPVERWVEFLDRFLIAHQDFFALAIGLEDHRLDCGRAGNRVIPCYGLPLLSVLALLARADLFVGIDSCMLHAADLFRIPGVGVFGPTNPAEFGFLLAPHRHVGGGCAIGDVTVDEVAAAAVAMIGR